MKRAEPLYIQAWQQGTLRERASEARHGMESCELCPRRCGVNRLAGETGVCSTGKDAWVSSFGPHFGEEAPLVGEHGSGTIFFTHCSLLCLFCQNFDISHQGDGQAVTPEQLAWIMLELQRKECHNINFVTPSHVVPQILSALEIAVEKGLNIPLVYNSSGYDRVETLRMLDGIVDIFMPDFKFWHQDISARACNASDYPETARKALKEMHRQAGDLTVTDGLARQGLLIRHLVLPDGLAGTPDIMSFIAETLSKNTYVNVMPQYRPCGKAHQVEGLNRYPSQSDYQEALQAAEQSGIRRLDHLMFSRFADLIFEKK